VRSAVLEAQGLGLRVVLCTGRRYRTTLPVLEALGLEEGAVVLHNGVVVKELRSGATVEHSYLSADLYRQTLELARRLGPPLVFVDHHHEDLDIVTEPGQPAHPVQAEYLADNLNVTRHVDSLDAPPSEALIMLSHMGDEEHLRPVREEIHAALDDRVRTHLLDNKAYRGHLLQVLAGGSGKWCALERLAASQGIAPQEILAIGDDDNDAELVQRAGLGIAMANATPLVKAASDHLTESNAEDGVARALERFVLDNQPE